MPDLSLHELRTRLRQQGGATDRSLDDIRAGLDSAGSRIRLDPAVQVAPMRAAELGGDWLIPSSAQEGRAVLYLHGGAFVAGSCQSHRHLATQIAVASRSQTLLLDYRLAPEHPWPAAELDALSALRWLYAQGHEPVDVSVVGDSAGGNLAVASLLRAKDCCLPMPASLVLLSPWLDLNLAGASVRENANADPTLSEHALARCAALSLNGEAGTTSLDSDVSGFPRTLLQTGGDEILCSDAVDFASNLERAGVDVSLQIWPGLFHVWHAYAPWLQEARAAIERVGTFINSNSSVKS